MLKNSSTRMVGWGLVVCLVLASVFSAYAQEPPSAENSSILDRLDKLERSLIDLERSYYRQNQAVSGAQAPLPSSAVSETATGSFEVRLTQLENQIRELTGRLEELEFRLKSMQSSSSSNMEERVAALEAKTDMAPLAPSSSTSTMESALQQEKPLVSSDPIQQDYNNAFGMLKSADYANAIKAFEAFVSKYPSHELTSNAYYWLGEAYYAQENYEQASVQFARGYKQFPKGQKAPDNLLKLGMSLAALKKNREACTTYNKLLREFPESPSAIRGRADELRKQIACE